MIHREAQKLVDRELAERAQHPRVGASSDLHCSFCHTPRQKSKKLITRNGAYICDECVRQSVEILIEDGLMAPGPAQEPSTLDLLPKIYEGLIRIAEYVADIDKRVDAPTTPIPNVDAAIRDAVVPALEAVGAKSETLDCQILEFDKTIKSLAVDVRTIGHLAEKRADEYAGMLDKLRTEFESAQRAFKVEREHQRKAIAAMREQLDAHLVAVDSLGTAVEKFTKSNGNGVVVKTRTSLSALGAVAMQENDR